MIYIIAMMLLTLALAVQMLMFESRMKKFVADALCELMAAVFNQEAIKARCAEAFERGEKYVDISEV